MSKRESKLQKDCLAWVDKTHPDILSVNIHGGGYCNKGFPDVLLCINGMFIAVELKVGNNDMQSDQRIWKRRIERAGGRHYSAYTLDEFQSIVRECLAAEKSHDIAVRERNYNDE